MSQPSMEQLEQRFAAWAQTQPDIRAAFVVGSRARTDHPADQWSDLDIMVVTTRPERLLVCKLQVHTPPTLPRTAADT